MVEDQTPPDAEAPADAGTTSPAAPSAPVAPVADSAPLAWPEKFLNEDGSENRQAFLKAYHGLQNMLATTKRVPAQGPDALALPKDAPLDENAGVDELVRSVGLDPVAVGRQFMEKGQLTPNQYKALKTGGATRGMIDQFMKLQVQVNQTAQTQLLGEASKLAGGDEQRNTVLNWAKNNLSPEECEFYDTQAMNPANAMRGFEWLLGKYTKAIGAGSAQPLIAGTGGAPASTGGYTSQAEWLKANNDPRYETDNAYRAAVDARADKTDVKIIHGFPT